MSNGSETIGWIGLGRMGSPMCERLIKAGYTVKVWNRTREKALGLEAMGATLVDRPADLADVDVLFTMVSTGKDLTSVYFGENGVASGAQRPKIFVDCSSVGLEEGAAIRQRITEGGSAFLAAPVSGNGKCVKAGKLSQVVSGGKADFETVRPMLEAIAANGVSYVGEGELARICKIAHNVFLGVVTQNLAEITVLAERVGVSRHDFLAFINNSVMGSIFTRYKTPALVNLDWTTTFTPELMRKDMDLGLSIARKLDVAMPVSAATREAIQTHFGAASLKPDPAAYLAQDFAAVIETVALQAGVTLESENRKVASGLET
ncbi:3-hydroxyisobutyrate dehydrogenase [Devosia enhydra]|uniref:3-hydroxyisobutyrate dehydrogenase n=1 Tax=Devosia enhydra TaxID=665118 RepID=A0A1K2HU84_9HYPH|nr:NAD(P)-dependent oxidoreductase [Devosia enhydra]SFZ81561.1 3-hydroxyisobutyrate dehydrogenase [Devosia enhydra]